MINIEIEVLLPGFALNQPLLGKGENENQLEAFSASCTEPELSLSFKREWINVCVTRFHGSVTIYSGKREIPEGRMFLCQNPEKKSILLPVLG